VAGAFIGSPASIYGHIPIGYAGGLSTSGKFMPCSYYTDAAKTVGSGYYAIQNLITVTGISGKTLKSYLNPIYCSFDIALGYETSFPNCGSIANVYDALIANTDLSIPVQYTATAGGNTTLTDAGKAWTSDALIGKLVILTGGTGIGQCRKITDNDATSITVDRQWELNPDATTNYKICDTLYRCALGIAGYSNYVALKVTDTVIPA
jgi:hypothetical protein